MVKLTIGGLRIFFLLIQGIRVLFCFGRAETSKRAPCTLAHFSAPPAPPPPYPVCLDKIDNQDNKPGTPFSHNRFKAGAYTTSSHLTPAGSACISCGLPDLTQEPPTTHPTRKSR